jgi:predicted permease
MRLLECLLPRRDRDDIIGDLEEQFLRIRDRDGVVRARRWYWRQTLALLSRRHGDPTVGPASTRRTTMGLDDVRYAIRRLRKQPAATVASVLTLALAIGASVAAWSLLSAVLLHPLPVADPDQLVAIGLYNRRDNTGPLSMGQSYQLYPAIRDSGVFASVAAGGTWNWLVSTGGLAERRPVFFASYTFFDTLGVPPQLGRVFGQDDDRQGAPLVAMLSDRYWHLAFNAAPDVIGRTLTVSGKPVVVVGVAPSRFRGTTLTAAPDLYLPLHTIVDVGDSSTNFMDDGTRPESPTWWVNIFARLRPGMRVEEAQQRLSGLRVASREYGAHLGIVDINTAALPEALRAGMARFSRLLGVTVALLLVIGCLTVGMLQLLRSEARRDEFALCLALGASRARLGLGVALDGALLALAGAVASLPIAFWLFGGVQVFELPGSVRIDLLELRLDRAALLAALLAAAIATLAMALLAGVFGLASRTTGVLRARGGATPRVGRRWTRASLVVAQVAISLVLLVGAGLFLRSLASALSLNPHVDMTRLASGSVSLGGYGYTPERTAIFLNDVRARLHAHPAVDALSITSPQGGTSGRIVLDGTPRQVPAFVAFTGVDADYFDTMGMPVARGRNFTADDRLGSPRVAVVSVSFARFIASDGEALGHRITEGHNAPGMPPDVLEVVGIVPDVVTNVADLSPMVIYMPVAQLTPPRSGTIVLRAAADASAAVEAGVATIRGLDPSIPPVAFRTMEERISAQMGPQKLGATVLGGLGAIAALLTLFGTYVLVESMSALRRREMGVRAALGATRRQLSGIVMRETLRLVGAGLAVGLLLTWAGAGMIRTFLFGVRPFDGVTMAAVIGTMLLLAALVALRPALRAARVDLATVLRDE